MVLSKGNLEEFFSIHNTRRPAARGCDAAGELWELWPLIWKSRGRGARARRENSALLVLCRIRSALCCHPSPPDTFGPWARGGACRTQPAATTHSRARAVGGPWDLRRVTRQWLEWAVAPWVGMNGSPLKDFRLSFSRLNFESTETFPSRLLSPASCNPTQPLPTAAQCCHHLIPTRP